MKIYNCCDAQCRNNTDFRALRIKSEKRWPKFVLENMTKNKEMQKLIEYYNSKNIDIIARHYIQNLDTHAVLITLEDEFGTFMGCYSSDTFKYNNFSASSAKRSINIPLRQIKEKQNSSESFLSKIINLVKNFIKK